MFISMSLVKYLNVLYLKPCWLNFTKTIKTGKNYGWEMTIIIQMTHNATPYYNGF